MIATGIHGNCTQPSGSGQAGGWLVSGMPALRCGKPTALWQRSVVRQLFCHSECIMMNLLLRRQVIQLHTG
jgi:hypothetical protein